MPCQYWLGVVTRGQHAAAGWHEWSKFQLWPICKGDTKLQRFQLTMWRCQRRCLEVSLNNNIKGLRRSIFNLATLLPIFSYQLLLIDFYCNLFNLLTSIFFNGSCVEYIFFYDNWNFLFFYLILLLFYLYCAYFRIS